MGEPKEDYYYLAGTGETIGPLNAKEILRLRSKNKISDATLVKKTVQGAWLSFSDHSFLSNSPIAASHSIEGVYKIKYAWLYVLLIVPLCGLMGWAGSSVFSKGDFGGASSLWLVSFAIILFGWVDLTKSFIISSDEIKIKRLYGSKKLLLSEIAGIRTQVGNSSSQTLSFCPKDENQKELTISSNYACFKKIVTWATHHFTDLDEVESTQVLQSILSDHALGHTPESRASKLALAQKTVNLIKPIILAIGLWGLIWPQPYHLVIFLLVLAVFCPLLLLLLFRGYVVPGKNNSDPRPNLGFTILPLFALGMRGISDFNPLPLWWHLALPCVAVGLMVAATLDFKKNKNRWVIILAMGVFFLPVGFYGLLIEGNCLLDSSVAEHRLVRVLSYHTTYSSRGGIRYHIWVSPFPDCPEGKGFQVGRAFYESVSRQTPLVVTIHPGFFRIPWATLAHPSYEATPELRLN